MAILRFVTQNYSSQVAKYSDMRGEDTEMDIDPEYQRGHVWGKTRQRNLIRSLLSGIPCGTIIIGDRYDHLGNYPAGSAGYVVIDGKQRITAIREFMDGKLAVPGSWWEDADLEHPGEVVTWDDLTDLGQRKFKRCTIAASEGVVTSLDNEREIFDLINFGGVAQGSEDTYI